jgi:hypothetical protein
MSDDCQRRTLLLLLLLARAADLPLDEIDGPGTRALVAGALGRVGHRSVTVRRARPWMCARRRAALTGPES